MDDINIIVHNQLKEYAQIYFEAILTFNKGRIKEGNYTAKELADNNYKILGNAYKYPKDPRFAEEITITAGNFTCSFMYPQIFVILDKWEKMMRAGKAAAVFAVGSVEYKTAKLLTTDRDVFGKFKYKRVKLQRVAGNWWTPATKRAKTYPLYYELNGIMFAPGVNCYCEEDMSQRAERLTEEQVINALKGILKRNRDTLNEGSKVFYDYCTQVAQLAGVALDASDEQRNQLKEERKAEEERKQAEAELMRKGVEAFGSTQPTDSNNDNDTTAFYGYLAVVELHKHPIWTIKDALSARLNFLIDDEERIMSVSEFIEYHWQRGTLQLQQIEGDTSHVNGEYVASIGYNYALYLLSLNNTPTADANTAVLSDCEPSDSKIINSTDKVAEIANKGANLAYIEVNYIHSRQRNSTTHHFSNVGKVPAHSTDIIFPCRCVSIGSVQPTSAIVGKAPPGSGYYVKLTNWHRYNSYICRHRYNSNHYGIQTYRLESTGMGMAQRRGP